MLSILIPTYNYNVFPLVTELKNQADTLEIAYEILVQDDASDLFLNQNAEVNLLPYCSYALNHEKLGRGNNINLLNSLAKYNYVIIMEADVFGGVTYDTKKPDNDKLLRWKYGQERESISIIERKKNPYHFVFTWNLLIKKQLLSKYPFPSNIKNYGYEDVVFIKQLKQNNITIEHIENKLIHLNSETSLTFIKKTENAVSTLNQLILSNKLEMSDTKIGKAFKVIHFFKLQNVVRYIFKKLAKKMINNLTSSNPSIIVLDLYKLGYFCNLRQNENTFNQ
uniref:glycosyltransferase n=1 Tax=Flavobacterium sp. TaxID=239 RepID=UPI00404A0A60